MGGNRRETPAPPVLSFLADCLPILPAFAASGKKDFEKSVEFLKKSLFKRQKMVYNKKTEQKQRSVGQWRRKRAFSKSTGLCFSPALWC
jgi:hypothetical protein